MKEICAILCSLFIGCSGSQPGSPRAEVQSQAREVIDDAALDLFRQNSVDGAFVLYDARRSMTTIVNPSLAARGFLPASTFKIPNTVIGLETGVIPDEHFSQRWDGVKRGRTEWNRDQDLASATKYSVVWFYQDIARRIGQTRMQKWLDAIDYGNHDTSGGIDVFWLQGGLRITPRQQVDFLWRLHTGKLPVSREHVALVERLIILDSRNGVVFRGKTGGGVVPENTTIGWLVGMVERGEQEFVYAMVLTTPGDEFERIAPMRQVLARKLLLRAEALPVEMGTE